ncbi:MAG: very short patch repair endonuclease [Nitrospirae bacterium]|nr:very short patch repair endonuclease [Nitrospirota bacterium]
MAFAFVTTPERSKNMAAIRSKGNLTTELRMARLMRSHKISGWRRHLNLPGKPDFAFPKERVAVFVDGCFWHFCPRCTKIPRRNEQYWIEKSERNKSRDRRASRILRKMGWSVIRIWEHALNNEEIVAARVKRSLQRNKSSETKT